MNRRKYVVYIFIAITSLVSSCFSGNTMKSLDPYIFLHDNSSKVWFVDKLLVGDKDYTPFQFKNRQLIAFHESRNAYFYRIKTFAEKGGLKTMYWMDRGKKEFGFQVGKKEWLFTIKAIGRKRIILAPKNNSYPYTIVLIPFPEY